MRKAQAAMEFLMTYGWAILIIAVIIGALFALDVFSPNSPNICSSSYPIACSDIKLDNTGKIEITLSESDTSMANLTKIDLINPVEANCNVLNGEIVPDKKNTLNCNPSPIDLNDLSDGERFSGIAEIKYILSDGGSEHLIKLKFSGTIEKG
jgi:hypothetical protein